MLNQEQPKEYVLSSNETHSIREFVEKAFAYAHISGNWNGEGPEEKLLNEGNNIPLVKINENFYRPAEVDLLYGNSNPIREELGWKPKISFDKLVERMVIYDLELEHAKR